MEKISFKSRIVKTGRSYRITVPYQYIIDGIIDVKEKYKVIIITGEEEDDAQPNN